MRTWLFVECFVSIWRVGCLGFRSRQFLLLRCFHITYRSINSDLGDAYKFLKIKFLMSFDLRFHRNIFYLELPSGWKLSTGISTASSDCWLFTGSILLTYRPLIPYQIDNFIELSIRNNRVLKNFIYDFIRLIISNFIVFCAYWFKSKCPRKRHIILLSYWPLIPSSDWQLHRVIQT